MNDSQQSYRKQLLAKEKKAHFLLISEVQHQVDKGNVS